MGSVLIMKKYKVAVIGLGKIGMTYDLMRTSGGPFSHVFAYKNNQKFEVVAGVDPLATASAKFLELFPNGKFYLDYEQMLRENKIEAVSICTPPQYHLEQIKTVLEYETTKLIFCEKPLVNNVTEHLQLKKIMQDSNCVLMPNISRRFNLGLQEIKKLLEQNIIGEIQKVHIRYTRGIYNTGAHMFDLLSWWIGKIDAVQTIKKIPTSSELEGENSYSFNFIIGDIVGYAEAFDDQQYYLFEFDIYGSRGKIEFRKSGDEVFIKNVGMHSLFPEHKELKSHGEKRNLLASSNFTLAMENIAEILAGKAEPICRLEDAAYPLYVAQAIELSEKTKTWERIEYER